MTKVDLKRDLDCYRARRDDPCLIEVPDLRYLMIEGHGDPDATAFTEATAALYPVAYAVKFASRGETGRDYVVMPFEGLWWADDMSAFGVQALHVGSFDDEGPLLRRIHEEFVPAKGLALAGTHHEIYLSDPRRTAPHRLRTILRQPVSAGPGSVRT